MGKLYCDGVCVERDTQKAIEWFRRSADEGNSYSEYALGKMLLELGDNVGAIDYLTRSDSHGNQQAPYLLGKLCLEGKVIPKDVGAAVDWFQKAKSIGNNYADYALGKFYLMGRDVPRDEDRGLSYLRRAADHGITPAQDFLEHRHEQAALHAAEAVQRMLRSMASIFRQQAATDRIYRGMQIDKKRRKEMLEMRLALGHRIDDHEDERNNINLQTM